MLKRVCNSRLVFLDTKENLVYVGDFVKDENGVRYSNTTYKPYTYNYSKYNWDDYDYYWDDYKYPITTKTDTTDNEDKWDDPYEDYEEYPIEEFVKEKRYTQLKVGDIVELSDSNIWEVETNDTYFYTDEGDVFEYYGGYMSLIATDTILLKDYSEYKLRGCAV